MTAKEIILERIRTALKDVPQSNPEVDVPIDWVYGRALATEDIVLDFVEKVRDYRATVVRVAPDGVTAALTEALQVLGSQRVVLPAGLPSDWVEAVLATSLVVSYDEPQLTHAELNDTDTVITTSAVGMADSGTIALTHGAGQGRRALTLLPDRHLCVVRASDIVSDVPEGVALLSEAMRNRRPITWLSGGSATSDIELERVEGVHGPRTLYVVVVED